MKDYYIFIILYYVLISVYAVALAVFDKSRAIKRRRRIPENALLWVGALGGAGAMYLTMKFIHHKTRVKKFMVLLPVFSVVHIVLIILIIVFITAKPA